MKGGRLGESAHVPPSVRCEGDTSIVLGTKAQARLASRKHDQEKNFWRDSMKGYAAVAALVIVCGSGFFLGGGQGEIGGLTGKPRTEKALEEMNELERFRAEQKLEQEKERRELYLWYAQDEAKKRLLEEEANK